MNFSELTIKEAVRGIFKEEFSAKELVSYFLKKIEKEDSSLGAFLSVAKEKSLKKAERIDKMEKEEKLKLKLPGIPIAIKDNILVEGLKCTAGSRILENYIAPYNATVIEKLEKEGAVIIGKTNLDEFAMGSSCENSAFFPTRNPFDKERVAGGSSGGSAAAVSAGFSLASLGSDTGGSIRLPASFCGVVGFKPSYGAVSRYGLIALSSSLDQIGPLAKTVEGVKEIFKIIAGKDPRDATSREINLEEKKVTIKGLKIALPKEFFQKGIKKEVEEKVREAIEKLEKEGAEVREISLPRATDISLAVYYIIMPSEASANLARYDGIRYGKSKIDEAKDIVEVYFKTRGEYLGDEVKRRIMLGTFALSSGYYDAYYLKAQKVRKIIAQDFEKVFQDFDVILTPTSPDIVFKIGEKEDPLSMYLSDIYMTAANLVGLPAISLPWGKVRNLPVGIQLIGDFAEDTRLLQIAGLIEKLR